MISAYIIIRLPPLPSLSPFLKRSEKKQNLSEQFQIYVRYYTLSRYIMFLGKFSCEQNMFEIALFGTRVDSQHQLHHLKTVHVTPSFCFAIVTKHLAPKLSSTLEIRHKRILRNPRQFSHQKRGIFFNKFIQRPS